MGDTAGHGGAVVAGRPLPRRTCILRKGRQKEAGHKGVGEGPSGRAWGS